MTALVPILVAVFNALAQLGPKVVDLFAQVKASPDLSADGARLLGGIEKNIDAHLKYLAEREPLKPSGTPKLLTARQEWGIDRANGRRLDEPMPPAEPGDAVPDSKPTRPG